jgi:hypothetical protein
MDINKMVDIQTSKVEVTLAPLSMEYWNDVW